jgi:hypothetical protein
VPPPGPGVCRICCGPTSERHAVCFACLWVSRRLGHPLATVVPVRLCPLPSALYAVLMGYKESPVSEARRRFAPMVRDLFDGFLAHHDGCLAAAGGGPVGLVLPVPSSARPAGSPLNGVAGLSATVHARVAGTHWSPAALVRSEAPVAHMRPAPRAFETPPACRARVAGTRVLLLDDTYVSGARAQSAAAALRRAGARSVVILVLGRVLRPDRSAAHAAFLGRNEIGTDRDHGVPGSQPCCRCAQTAAATE